MLELDRGERRQATIRSDSAMDETAGPRVHLRGVDVSGDAAGMKFDRVHSLSSCDCGGRQLDGCALESWGGSECYTDDQHLAGVIGPISLLGLALDKRLWRWRIAP